MDRSAQVREAVTAASAVVAQVGPDDLTRPTPCEKFDVGTLAGHMTGFLLMTEQAAAKAPLEQMSGDPAEPTDGAPMAWQQTYATHAPAVADRWSAPDAWAGTTRFGPGDFDAGMAGSVTLMELVIHGWDLARATGQDLAVSDGLGRTVRATVRSLSDPNLPGDSFGPPLQPPSDATPLQEALAASGRDPGWRR
jgi:uncharacterized protein (TIGR03086 family)